MLIYLASGAVGLTGAIVAILQLSGCWTGCTLYFIEINTCMLRYRSWKGVRFHELEASRTRFSGERISPLPSLEPTVCSVGSKPVGYLAMQ